MSWSADELVEAFAEAERFAERLYPEVASYDRRQATAYAYVRGWLGIDAGRDGHAEMRDEAN